VIELPIQTHIILRTCLNVVLHVLHLITRFVDKYVVSELLHDGHFLFLPYTSLTIALIIHLLSYLHVAAIRSISLSVLDNAIAFASNSFAARHTLVASVSGSILRMVFVELSSPWI